MENLYPIEKLAIHENLWARLQFFIEKQEYPQALLLVAERHGNLQQFSNRLMALILCEKQNACGTCAACSWIIQGIHPDIHWIEPEGTDKSIKIERIRDLQTMVFQKPKSAAYRIVLINPAEKLNHAAANALLKLLEEPPAHLLFILLAEQMGSMLPTILSRCQKYSLYLGDSLQAALQYYGTDSPRGKLLQARPLFKEKLQQLWEEKITVCELAKSWLEYDLADLLWFLYLLHSEAIQARLLEQVEIQKKTASVDNLFQSIDKISANIRKLNHNIAINANLALEDILLVFKRTVT